MKRIIFSIGLSLVAFLFNSNASATTLHYETATFKVYGNCEMCKSRIEKALLTNTHIKTAVWDVNTKMLTVTYDPHAITVDQIHQLVADAGHDTDKTKASNAVYKKLPGCCQYQRKK